MLFLRTLSTFRRSDDGARRPEHGALWPVVELESRVWVIELDFDLAESGAVLPRISLPAWVKPSLSWFNTLNPATEGSRCHFQP